MLGLCSEGDEGPSYSTGDLVMFTFGSVGRIDCQILYLAFEVTTPLSLRYILEWVWILV